MIPLPPAGPLFVGIFLNHKWKWVFGSKPSDHIRPFHFWGTKLWCISTCNSKTKKNSKIERPKSKNPTRNLPTWRCQESALIYIWISLSASCSISCRAWAEPPLPMFVKPAACAHLERKICRFCHLMVIRRILFKIQWTKHALFPH